MNKKSHQWCDNCLGHSTLLSLSQRPHLFPEHSRRHSAHHELYSDGKERFFPDRKTQGVVVRNLGASRRASLARLALLAIYLINQTNKTR